MFDHFYIRNKITNNDWINFGYSNPIYKKSYDSATRKKGHKQKLDHSKYSDIITKVTDGINSCFDEDPYEFEEEVKEYLNSLKYVVLNYFCKVPIEAFRDLRKETLYFVRMKKAFDDIVTYRHFSKEIITHLINKVMKIKMMPKEKGSVFISCADNYKIRFNFKNDNAKKRLTKLHYPKLYSTYDLLKSQSASLSFSQKMKSRLALMETAEYYHLAEDSHESQIEEIFIDIFKLKII